MRVHTYSQPYNHQVLSFIDKVKIYPGYIYKALLVQLELYQLTKK